MAHNRGGIREGAGRKPSGKSKVQFWIDPIEADFLRKMLNEYREGINLFEINQPTNDEIVNCPKCGSPLVKKISSLSRKEYLECTGANCIFTKDV